MSRSSSTTGILASLASFNTESHPVETTGARKMASTFCAMNDRIARIWFSCFCCASAILSVTPCFLASSLETVVSAARHPDSDPICENPIVMSLATAGRTPTVTTNAVPSKKPFIVPPLPSSRPRLEEGSSHNPGLSNNSNTNWVFATGSSYV